MVRFTANILNIRAISGSQNYPTRPLEACEAYETSGLCSGKRTSNAHDVPPRRSFHRYLDDDVQVAFRRRLAGARGISRHEGCAMYSGTTARAPLRRFGASASRRLVDLQQFGEIGDWVDR